MAVNLPKSSYQTGPDVRSFYNRVTRATQTIPGVEEVGAISDLPLTPSDEWTAAFQGKGPDSGVPHSVLLSWVSGDAMKTLGMKLVAGGFISDRDGAEAPKAMVINEALARRAWPHENPIGKRLSLGGPPDSEAGSETVVGMVRDVRSGSE